MAFLVSGARLIFATRRPFGHLAALLLFSSLSYGFYKPPSPAAGFTYLGIGADPLGFIWYLNWWPFAFRHHLPLFFTDFAYYPVGRDMVWRTSLAGLSLLTAPLISAFGTLSVYNALMLLSPGLAGWAAYLAAEELAGQFLPALMAGLIFGFCNYEIGEMLGHLNLAFTMAVPLCLWACLRAGRHQWPPSLLGLVLGILLAFQFGVSQEIFATTGFFGVICLGWMYFLDPALRPSLRRLMPGFALGLIVFLGLTGPFIWQMLRWYKTEQSGFVPAASVSSDLLSFFVPTEITWLGGRFFTGVTMRFPGNYSEEGGYFGLPLLFLLGFIYIKSHRWPAVKIAAGMLVVTAIFSLGPTLHFFGHAIGPAPWRPFHGLPFFDAMLPGRFVMFSWLAAAMMIALWLSSPALQPGGVYRRYAILAACLFFVLPDRAFDRHWTVLSVPKIFTAPAAQRIIPAGRNVFVLPYFGNEMGYQYASGMDFHLAAQGDLGAGPPDEFSRWPLYPALWHNDFAAINPAEFKVFLAAYHTEYVVVLNDAFPQNAAAQALLQKAGWKIAAVNDDATVFTPLPAAAEMPSEDVIEAFANAERLRAKEFAVAAHQAKLLRAERYRVCQINRIAHAIGADPAPFLRFYVWRVQPPLPVERIDCR